MILLHNTRIPENTKRPEGLWEIEKKNKKKNRKNKKERSEKEKMKKELISQSTQIRRRKEKN